MADVLQKIHWILGGIILEKNKIQFRSTETSGTGSDACVQSIDELRNDQGCLMPIMQKAQDIYGYLPYEVQKMISDELDVPMEKSME